MNFLAIFVAFLLEQARPLASDNPAHQWVSVWTRWARRTLDAGQVQHGWLAWGLAAGVPTVTAAVVHIALWRFSVLLSFGWLVFVLYLTLGFRQFSHHFTTIREALEAGDEETARSELADWQEVGVGQLPRQEILRHVIEHSALAAHRHVFGVLLCFIVFALLGLGPAGAVLYRVAEYVSRHWQEPDEGVLAGAAPVAARQAWRWIDWAPARATGIAFAIMGNFEEAVSAWRQDAKHFPNHNDGVVLAATSGAINVRLGGLPLGQSDTDAATANVTDGREPQLAHLASLVGLVWRSVVLWLTLMALMTLARAVG